MLLAPLKKELGVIPFRHCGVEQVDWDVTFAARFASIRTILSLNELSRTEPELVIVASHDEEQHIELTRQRLLSSQLE